MIKPIRYLLVTIIFLNVTPSLIAQVLIGEPAPEITVDTWVSNPSYAFQKIEGKAILLDFWFTHCAPCIYTVPHLNDLSEEYKNEEIVFVSVTFEPEEVVSAFIQKKKMLANIGTDTTHQLIKAYGVSGYPTTFLIDKSGVLRWKGYPSHINIEIIDLVLKKQFYPEVKMDESVMQPGYFRDLKLNKTYPIDVSVNNYMDAGSGFQMNANEISMVNYPLDNIFSVFYQTGKKRVVVPDTLTGYDVRFKIPEELKHTDILPVVAASLLHELGYEAQWQKQTVNRYRLELMYDSLFIANAIDTTKTYFGMGTSQTQTHWKGSGVSVPVLVKELEAHFDTFIFDETNLNGFFEFQFSIESLDKARKDLYLTYGLTLTPAKSEVELLVIK